LRQRRQRGSKIITSNRSVEAWVSLLGEKLLAAAAALGCLLKGRTSSR
jgi:hypothetical protein